MQDHEEARLLTLSKLAEPEVATRTIRKLDRRVLLLCTGVIFLAYVDRSNIGYAAKDLCNDLKLTHEEYGIGVSLFYAGYLTTQMLSNVILKRIGAPAWLAIIMFAWGVVAAAMGFMQNTAQFYILRVLLGVAEGGTFPSVWYFLSLFYPEAHVTGAYTVTVSAVSLAMPVSSPISAGLLSLGPVVGVEGWRLLFLVEGLIPVFYAFVLYIFLPRDPWTAWFLEPEEKDWIITETKKRDDALQRSFFEEVKIVLANRPCRILTATLMITFGVCNVLMFWATLIIHEMLNGDDDDDEDSKTCSSAEGNAAVAIILTAIPYVLSGLACLWVRATTINNRSRFCAIVSGLGALTLISWVGTREVNFVLGFISLSLSIGSGFITIGPNTGLALSFFDNSTRATASAIYNMLSCVGAVVFPPIIGIIFDDFGYGVAIPLCGVLLIVAAVLVLLVKDPQQGRSIEAPHATEIQEA